MTYSGGLISNNVPTIIELIFKTINRATIIIVSNLKYEIEKATLAKFGNNSKNLLDFMSSNYSIVIDKVERDENYVIHIFRDIFSGPTILLKGTRMIGKQEQNSYQETSLRVILIIKITR